MAAFFLALLLNGLSQSKDRQRQDAGYELDAMCGEAVRDSPAAAPRSNISAPQRHRRGTEPLREESVILHREGSGIGT